MKWIERHIEKEFSRNLKPGKVLTILGARRVGKTSVIKKYLEKSESRIYLGTGDDLDLQDILSSQRLSTINAAFRGYDIVFIDEAQRIPNIGMGLKLMVDSNPDMKIIASGSSSFELSNQLGEPLTGRQIPYKMFPLSMLELSNNYGGMHIFQNINNYLIHGAYPEVLTASNDEQKQFYLINLRNSYLFKDILELEKIRNASKLSDLLKLLAFQIGNEVSLNELSNSLGLAKQTIERYLDLLEKAFIIIKINGYSSNLRKEVTKTSRYYFWDNGVRNSLINNFNNPDTRMDMGMLWENFCVIERIKKQHYHQIFANNYFWRTYDKQEVDFVEERDGKLFGYEFKWNPKKRTKNPKAFLSTYKNAELETIHPENCLPFLT